jgi:hypothetical protein
VKRTLVVLEKQGPLETNQEFAQRVWQAEADAAEVLRRDPGLGEKIANKFSEGRPQIASDTEHRLPRGARGVGQMRISTSARRQTRSKR